MLKLMGWMMKCTILSIVVLVLGNWVQWDGKTVSDQIKTQLSHAEKSEWAGDVRHWASQVTQDARVGIQKKSSYVTRSTHSNDEEITASERQKLRSLIRELNQPHGRN